MKKYCLIISTDEFLDYRVLIGYLECAQDQGYIGKMLDRFIPIYRQEYVEDLNKSLIENGFPRLPSEIAKKLEAKIGYPDIEAEIEFLKERGISGEKLKDEIEVLKLESENWFSSVEATVAEIKDERFYEIAENFSKRYNLEMIYFDIDK